MTKPYVRQRGGVTRGFTRPGRIANLAVARTFAAGIVNPELQARAAALEDRSS